MWPVNRAKRQALRRSEVDCVADGFSSTEKPVPCADCGKLPEITESVGCSRSLKCRRCGKGEWGATCEQAVKYWNERNAEDEKLLYKPLKPCPYCGELPKLSMGDGEVMTLSCDVEAHHARCGRHEPFKVDGSYASMLARKWNAEIDRQAELDLKLLRIAEQLRLDCGEE